VLVPELEDMMSYTFAAIEATHDGMTFLPGGEPLIMDEDLIYAPGYAILVTEGYEYHDDYRVLGQTSITIIDEGPGHMSYGEAEDIVHSFMSEVTGDEYWGDRWWRIESMECIQL
jgi:hypothetical protein